jgi:hypothetical protein
MNRYAADRDAFFSKWFPWIDRFEAAVRSTDPSVFVASGDTRHLRAVGAIDGPQELIRRLDGSGCIAHFEWAYDRAAVRMTDSAGFRWSANDGLSVHLEWLCLVDRANASSAPDMDDPWWQLLFEKRGVILSKLLPGAPEGLSRHEDIVVRLTDNRLMPVSHGEAPDGR